MTTWVEDENGNKCSVEYFGTREAAQAALDSLKNCVDCTNCSCCSRCLGCSRCSGCSYCSGCSDCKNKVGDFVPPTVPKIANIHTVIFEAASQPQALNMSHWHTYGTTHCRAGWVVHKAGEAGYALERFHGTALAAQLIYRESDPENPVSPVRFYETNEQALADMKRLADAEAAKVRSQ